MWFQDSSGQLRIRQALPDALSEMEDFVADAEGGRLPNSPFRERSEGRKESTSRARRWGRRRGEGVLGLHIKVGFERENPKIRRRHSVDVRRWK